MMRARERQASLMSAVVVGKPQPALHDQRPNVAPPQRLAYLLCGIVGSIGQQFIPEPHPTSTNRDSRGVPVLNTKP
jgi:hypothetical protein